MEISCQKKTGIVGTPERFSNRFSSGLTITPDKSAIAMCMGGECRMAGVAVATPTLIVPHQHFAL